MILTDLITTVIHSEIVRTNQRVYNIIYTAPHQQPRGNQNVYIP